MPLALDQQFRQIGQCSSSPWVYCKRFASNRMRESEVPSGHFRKLLLLQSTVGGPPWWGNCCLYPFSHPRGLRTTSDRFFPLLATGPNICRRSRNSHLPVAASRERNNSVTLEPSPLLDHLCLNQIAGAIQKGYGMRAIVDTVTAIMQHKVKVKTGFLNIGGD